MLGFGELFDLYCFLKFILIMMLPYLGLLVWTGNKVSNSSEVSHYSMGEELVQTSDEMGQFFEQEHEENTRAHCACSFCGKLSHITTICSCCKAAFYCSEVCHVMHWRFWHKHECVEIETAKEEGSPSRGTHCLLMEPENKTFLVEMNSHPYQTKASGWTSRKESSQYSFNEVVQKRDVGEVHYIEERKEHMRVYDGCSVCGNPSTKKCSRCKAIKYCSQTCQHSDWRLRHKFQCVAATVNQEGIANGNVVVPTYSCVEEDNAHPSDPFSLEYYSEGNSDAKARILSYQEASSNTGQKETEDRTKSLKEEMAKIKNENMLLRSERDNWELNARHAVDKLYSFRKENEHQLFILKHENELISNAEKQALQMVDSLSQKLHCLQIEVETGVAERKKQGEYIHMLQNECAKTKTELQEQKKCVRRLSVELDEATQFPTRIVEETRHKFADAHSVVAAVEVNLGHPERKITQPDDQENFMSKFSMYFAFQTISLTRNPMYTRQACSICLANEKDMAFGCGHMTCRDCGSKILKCHICRKQISNRIRLFPG